MQPLAETLRPKTLKDFVGQDHLVGKSGIITKLLDIQTKNFPSLILWGPPGCGKTTLARIIANSIKKPFFELSAVNTSSKMINEIVEKEDSPIIFIDEIHRFNKSQQSRLLPYVENGKILFIGATTENPSFEVIAPLLSRTRVLLFKNLDNEELKKIIKKALKHLKVKIKNDAENFLIDSASGDARIIINVLEIAKSLSRKPTLKIKDIEEALQKKQLAFDKHGDNFYDTISAFIKSLRASDVNAAIYYLARMVEAGQDPLYIARRMVVFASEDIGMAQPTALVVANDVFRACETIGYPECQENLAHGVVYLATAKKDRSSYNAYMEALSDVRKLGNLPIPLKIRNPVTKLMGEIGYGKNYKKYDVESYLPERLKGKKYYNKQ
ncbi:AAA family ATPase [Candidatus Woesebacteria bacterium RIFOXYC1_FULL_31_51]|uniref:Replication-associated recombination protein A n=1 Tax=Candidatus Woesebacteria bacterium GW2011_GWC2_31_9 TaxID=1618586 RepID=A0A0F9YH50_9BACT|nr:MAG: recombination factor protein RarA, putative ATPase [Candidatus Woesebacteria bacterium GW2011_GWF1_31_35]KKP23421.1 MAG: Replication-associated recombination protein A [Candidatus Woesebacteria bacterium GW2011_GWC1_30_29]KKP26398.1 MAG: Replication-associated recombination protein A [Candidatus Woesebacteria bacterium GW2011_GWD1_31_12]KKP27697.1 MAG: Replication-associated recombination protein A [Candidatus Woesebacteria bacterium GW2011_GWB1_31_29]KKP30914.1 MAG: Replication-associa